MPNNIFMPFENQINNPVQVTFNPYKKVMILLRTTTVNYQIIA
ncbi:hypothetical protein [Flavobacterium sp. XS2P39]